MTRSIYFRGCAFDGDVATCDDLDSPVRWRGGDAARVDIDALRRVCGAR